MPVQFGFTTASTLPHPKTYAQPAGYGGNKHLRLWKTPEGYLFVNQDNAKGALHAFTIINNPGEEPKVRLMMNRRPALGGQVSVELPGGLWGDEDSSETALEAANKEVREEAGFNVDQSRLLADNMFATSAGMTTEMKAFALTQVSGQAKPLQLDETEKRQFVGHYDVPLSTFTDYNKFTAWLKEQADAGRVVSMTVLAARGLLPPQLDITG